MLHFFFQYLQGLGMYLRKTKYYQQKYSLVHYPTRGLFPCLVSTTFQSELLIIPECFGNSSGLGAYLRRNICKNIRAISFPFHINFDLSLVVAPIIAQSNITMMHFENKKDLYKDDSLNVFHKYFSKLSREIFIYSNNHPSFVLAFTNGKQCLDIRPDFLKHRIVKLVDVRKFNILYQRALFVKVLRQSLSYLDHADLFLENIELIKYYIKPLNFYLSYTNKLYRPEVFDVLHDCKMKMLSFAMRYNLKIQGLSLNNTLTVPKHFIGNDINIIEQNDSSILLNVLAALKEQGKYWKILGGC